MTATLHLGVRNAFAAALLASPALAGGRVHPNRDYSLAQGEASAINVYRRQSLPERYAIAGGPIDWQTEIECVVKARTTIGATAEAAADDIAGAIFARIYADPSLGGVAMDTEPGPVVWEQEEADTNVATCTLTFTVAHRTAGNTIT